MSDPQNFGLDELGQRVQAMGDPGAEPRLRPFPGAPLPIGATVSQRSASQYQGFEDARMMPPAAPATQGAQAAQAAYQPGSQFAQTPQFPQPGAYQASSSVLNQTPTQSTPYQAAPFQPAPFQPAPVAPPASSGSEPPLASSNGNPWGQPSATDSFAESQHASATQSSASVSAANLTAAADDPYAAKSGFQRVVNAVRTTLPLVQRLLPLLDGNFATTLSALMGPHSGLNGHPPPAQVHVDLEPIERGLTDLRTSHRDLRGQVQEQLGTLKRVEDQLERVREATDRNTLEQQELVEDLRSVGNRISTFAVVGVILLAVSLGLNIYFLVQLQHILR